MAESELMQGIDIDDVPELVALAEEVRRTNKPRVLRRGSEDIAMLAPVGPQKVKRKRLPAGKPFTRNDALWDVVGIGQSEESTNMAQHKHDYIADAYDPRKE